MPVVVDASVIAAIAFGEPDGPALTRHLSGQYLLAPTLIDYELANVALVKSRRAPADAAAIAMALGAATGLRMARHKVDALEALDLGRRTGLTAYDASYLWLALAHDAELVTLDRKLAAAASDPARLALVAST